MRKRISGGKNDTLVFLNFSFSQTSSTIDSSLMLQSNQPVRATPEHFCEMGLGRGYLVAVTGSYEALTRRLLCAPRNRHVDPAIATQTL